MRLLEVWSRLRSIFSRWMGIPSPSLAALPPPSLPAPVSELSLVNKPASAVQWLRYGNDFQERGEDAQAVRAYRMAALLFRDAGKVAQHRAALKLALRVDPTDELLLTELRLLAAHRPAPPVPPAETAMAPLVADEADAPSTRKLSEDEWRAVLAGAQALDERTDEFAAGVPTVVVLHPARA